LNSTEGAITLAARPIASAQGIAAAQKTILASGMLAVGPSPKHGGKPNAVEARAKVSLRC
jgi:hypothetical protein